MSLVLLLSLAPLARAEEKKFLRHQLVDGEINWSTYSVRVRGLGEPDRSQPNLALSRTVANRQAEQEVSQKISDLVLNLPVSGRETVRDRLFERGDLLAHMRRSFKQFRTNDTLQFSHGGVEIAADYSFLEFLPRLLGERSRDGTANVEAPRTASQESERDLPFSGLVIDLTAQSFQPVLAPTIATEEGALLFDPKGLSANILAERGPVGYWVTVADAQSDARMGKKPRVVKAARVDSRSRIILSTADTRDQQLGNAEEIFSQGRVCLVVANP